MLCFLWRQPYNLASIQSLCPGANPSWHRPRASRSWTGQQPVTGLTWSGTTSHTHSLHPYRVTNQPTEHVFGQWEEAGVAYLPVQQTKSNISVYLYVGLTLFQMFVLTLSTGKSIPWLHPSSLQGHEGTGANPSWPSGKHQWAERHFKAPGSWGEPKKSGDHSLWIQFESLLL